MSSPEVFYYKFKKNYIWLIPNLVMLALLIKCSICCPAMLYWWQVQVLFALFTLTLLVWGYKYLLKHPVAVVSALGVKIDHCDILPWHEIVSMEYRTVRCCWRNLPVIVLHPRKNMKYRYNFLQKRCAKMDFTAFSLPLYDIDPQDAKRLVQRVTEETGIILKAKK